MLLTGLIGLLGCGGGSSPGPATTYFVDRISPSQKISSFEPESFFYRGGSLPPAASVTLGHETRVALLSRASSPLRFDVELPSRPVLRFAVGAATPDAASSDFETEFRVSAESRHGEVTLFSEPLYPSMANRWIEHEVRLDAWSETKLRVRFEATVRTNPGAAAPNELIPLWGNPVLTGEPRRSPRPTIILISIDCLRSDHVGTYGYARATTPRIDALAEDGVVFETAIAASSWTHPTHMSMFTGLPVSFHGASKERKLGSSVAYLPELLARAGYQADGIVSGPYLSQDYGFERGFHVYRDLFPMSFFELANRNRFAAETSVEAALELLRTAQGREHFLFLHLIDPHWPYVAPPAFLERFASPLMDIDNLLAKVRNGEPPEAVADVWQLIDLYDAEVAFTDDMLGRFLDELAARNLYDSSLIVLTSDHGEAFYEHGHWEHAASLFEEIVRVPLIVKWPESSLRGRVSQPVSQIDVFATILEEAGLEPPHGESVSLRTHLENSSEEHPRRFIPSEIVWDPEKGEVKRIALRTRDMKYIATFVGETGAEPSRGQISNEELYDLVRDPQEENNLLEDSSSIAAEYRQLLLRYLDAAGAYRTAPGERVEPDESTLERLESLGYLDGKPN